MEIGSRRLSSFIAKDQNGQTHKLTIWVDVHIKKMYGGETEEFDGLKHVRTDSGDPVNRLKKGRYQTLTGEILTSDDPNAP